MKSLNYTNPNCQNASRSKHIYLWLDFSLLIINEKCETIFLLSPFPDRHDLKRLKMFLIPWQHSVGYFTSFIGIISIHYKRTVTNLFNFCNVHTKFELNRLHRLDAIVFTHIHIHTYIHPPVNSINKFRRPQNV